MEDQHGEDDAIDQSSIGQQLSIALEKAFANAAERPSANLMAVLFLIAGMGSYWVWARYSLYGSPALQNISSESEIAFYLLNILVHGIVLFCAGLFANLFVPFANHHAYTLVVLFLSIGGTVCMFASVCVGPDIANSILMVGSALSGVGMAGIIFLWACIYSIIPSERIRASSIMGAAVFGIALNYIIDGLPEIVSLVLVVIFPIVAIVCAKKGLSCGLAVGTVKPLQPKVKRRTFIRPPSHLFAYCFIFGIPLGFFRTQSVSATTSLLAGNWVTITSSALLLIFLVLGAMYFANKWFKANAKGKLAAPLMTAGLLLLSFPLFDVAENNTVAGVLIFSGFFFYQTYVYIELAGVLSSSRAGAVRIFSIGVAATDFSIALGAGLGVLSRPLSEMGFVGVTIGITYLLFICGFFLLNNQSLPKNIEQSRETSDHLSIASSVSLNCRAIVRNYRLSEREAEVLNYLVRGRSAQSVAKELHVSANTARTHISHIYAKCGVHSREDLIVRVEELYEAHTETRPS